MNPEVLSANGEEPFAYRINRSVSLDLTLDDTVDLLSVYGVDLDKEGAVHFAVIMRANAEILRIINEEHVDLGDWVIISFEDGKDTFRAYKKGAVVYIGSSDPIEGYLSIKDPRLARDQVRVEFQVNSVRIIDKTADEFEAGSSTSYCIHVSPAPEESSGWTLTTPEDFS